MKVADFPFLLVQSFILMLRSRQFSWWRNKKRRWVLSSGTDEREGTMPGIKDSSKIVTKKYKFDVQIIQVSFAGGVAWDGEQIGGQQYLFFRGGNHFHFLPCEHHFHFLSCEQHSRYHCGKHCLHFLYCGNHFHFLHCEWHFHFLYCDTTFTFNIVR